MAWYAYCITEQETFQGHARARRPFPISGLKGIRGAPVLGYPSGEFAVVVSEYERRSDLDQQAVVDHARVVSECFRNSTVLPFRFGTIFDTDDALRRAVRANRRALVSSVGKLRGKAEMHLKLLVKDGTLMAAIDNLELPTTAGSEYLTRLREKASRQRDRQTKARALSVQVHKLFGPLEEDVCCRKIDAQGMLIDIAHLVDHKSVEKYQTRFNTAQRQLKNCELIITGPWPPYHFTPDKFRNGNGHS